MFPISSRKYHDKKEKQLECLLQSSKCKFSSLAIITCTSTACATCSSVFLSRYMYYRNIVLNQSMHVFALGYFLILFSVQKLKTMTVILPHMIKSTCTCNINRPFPSYLKPLFQSEAWCTTIHMKMSLICM